MRAPAAGTLVVVVLLAASANAPAAPRTGAGQLRSHSSAAISQLARARLRAMPAAKAVFRRRAAAARPATPAARASILSVYEVSVLSRINALRTARGLRTLRVSRGLTAAATYHTNQMGLRGFFEHESANGAPFWKRIERFYPSRRYRRWSVGENILWGSPDISPASAVREWMQSPPHRENLLSREWREIGLAASHFGSAPGEYGGNPVTIVTADFGVRS